MNTEKKQRDERGPPLDAPLYEVANILKTIDNWSFDIFALEDATENKPLKYLAYNLFQRYNIIEKFGIVPRTLEKFLNCMEEGYSRYPNASYHNSTHAADVTQTMHFMLIKVGLKYWLTDLEIFAALLAAIMHDYEHKGTMNSFEVMTLSDRALLYNDHSVNENHHISATFFVLRQDGCNIISNLSREEYQYLRSLIIEMVLCTDTEFHNEIVYDMQELISDPNHVINKHKALAIVLHACDISHPTKDWHLHSNWVDRLFSELFRQGDQEKKMGLPITPICDINTCQYNYKSHIQFMDNCVIPIFSVCSDMLEYILRQISGELNDVNANLDEENVVEGEKMFTIWKPWLDCIAANKLKWKQKSHC